MAISIGVEKHLTKISIHTLLNVRKSSKQELEGNFLSLIKDINNMPSANIIVYSKPLSTLRSGTRQGCSFSPFLPNIFLNVLANAMRQGKVKRIKIGNEKVKTPYSQIFL